MVQEVGLTTYQKETAIPRAKISSSQNANDYFRQIWEEDLLIRECMYALFLNRANNVTRFALISKGGTSGTVVDIKMISRLAISVLAHSVILAHNHPSGNLNPSDSDQQITTKIKEGLKHFDIEVLDHIILTKESYYSFTDEGLI